MGISASSTRGDVSLFSDLEPFFLSGVVKKPTRLGIGSYATVMELEVRGRKFAGKQLHSVLLEGITPEEKEHVVSRFADECKLLQSIQHPNIVEFLGVYVEKGSQVPCLVMECLDSPLSAFLDQHGVPDPPTCYNILSDVALGLRYLHQKSPPIVHRDLTANNVLLSSTLQAKISDLGVAKVLNISPATKSRMTKAPGTPCYMPPEALVDNPHYDTTIDCFSFGVLLIHTLSAKWPLPGLANTVGELGTLSPVSEFDRRNVYVLQIGLDHPLMGLIRRCLHNYSKFRPNSSTIVQEIVAIQANASKGCYVCSRHTATNPEFELSVTVGQEVTILGPQAGKWWKTLLMQAQHVGYIPSHLPLRDKEDCPTIIGAGTHSSRARDQLSFLKDDVMYLINSEGDNWFVVHKDTGMKGYVPRTSVAEPLNRKRWFFGTLDCALCDSLLKQGQNTHGSFLVHCKPQGGYCLTVTGLDETIKHHTILESNGAFHIKNDTSLPTLQDLISRYSQHPGLMGDTLAKPCTVEYGPLQPYCSQDVEEKGQVVGTNVMELEVGGRKCLGEPIEGTLFESHSPESLHRMQLRVAKDCNMLQSIQHPNIVQFLGVYFNKEHKMAYVVMECLHFTLSAYLEENKDLDSSTRYNILSDVALGLCYLHKQLQPIVHGDLSAESVLLSSALQAKISDVKVTSTFSNIPACQSHATQTRSSLKSCYLPPEAHSACSSFETSFDSFSFGVLIIHTLSARWPVPTYVNQGASCMSSSTQFDQRTEYMKGIGLTSRMIDMVRKCLQDSPDTRPNMSTIVKEFHLIMRGQIPVKEYVATSTHSATKPYELNAAIGNRFLGYRDTVHGVLKTQSVETHEFGYIPSYILTTQQLYIIMHSGTKTHGLKGGSIVKVIKRDLSKQWLVQCINTGQEGYVPSNSVTEFNTPSLSMTATSDIGNKRESTPGMIRRAYSVVTIRNIDAPKSKPPDASTSQEYPVYIAKYDYSADDDDELSFKEGDLLTVFSKEGKWWPAQLQSTGEKGTIPSNFVEEKCSLEAEEWFFKSLQRSDAEKLLMSNFNSCGSFLVRESQSKAGEYSLSVRGEKKVSHYLIEKRKDGTWALADTGQFKSIPYLVAHYSKQTGVLCARLQAPCLTVPSIRGTDIVASTTLEVTSGTPLTYCWKDHGIRIHVPADALKSYTLPQTMSIQVSLAGHFQLPDDMELVSAVYWVAFPVKLSSPVTVKLQHCASLQHPHQRSSLSFITAKCTQKTLPYNFIRLPGGVFSTDSSYGTINLTHFSGVAVGGESKEYSLRTYYISQGPTTWLTHFIVISNLEVHLKVVEEVYDKKRAEDGPKMIVTIVGVEIAVDINDDKGISLSNGWSIVPLIPPKLLRKNVESYERGKEIPSIQLQLDWSGDKQSRPKLSHKVNFIGVEPPQSYIRLTRELTESTPETATPLQRSPRQADHVELFQLLCLRSGGGQVIRIMDRVSAHWTDVAMALHFGGHMIDSIQSDASHEVKPACRIMFQKWLAGEGKTPASWDVLIQALEDALLGELARELKEALQ